MTNDCSVALGFSQEKKLSVAAKAIGVSPERLRHSAANKGAITKQGRAGPGSKAPRRMRYTVVAVRSLLRLETRASASMIGSYLSAVARFLEKNDRTLLHPFVGQSVSDILGTSHVLETNPNTLYRLSNASGDTFEQVYRVVV